jgi:ADP-heptose:LPS heptosyltransferase
VSVPDIAGPVDLAGVRRILVIRHRAGGDLLLTTPALRALREAVPGASIEVLTARGFRELLAGNSDVDRVIDFDRRSLVSQAALYVRLLRGGYDLVLDMVSTPRSAFMSALTRAPVRVGYDIRGRRGAYTVAVPREPLGADGPVLRYAPEAPLDLLRAIGIPAADLTLRFRVEDWASTEIEAWMKQSDLDRDRPIVACLPTGSWPAKTWGADRFAAALDVLAEEASVLWTWGPGERDAVAACRDRMRRRSVLAPATGWQALGALLKRCAVWIGNDSGPKHLAVALGVPTVTVFGPTHPRTWHPPRGPHIALLAEGLPCLHCNANVCPLEGQRRMRCMTDVSVESVVAAARALLRDANAEARCVSR